MLGRMQLCKPILKKNDKAKLEVLFEIVKRVIGELRHHNCEACQTSPPVADQKGHMKAGGCLDPENESSEGYIEQALGIDLGVKQKIIQNHFNNGTV